MIQSMMRLAIWGVAARQKEIIQEMHRLGVLHIGQNGAQKEAGPEGLAALRLLRGRILDLVESLGWTRWSSLPMKTSMKSKDSCPALNLKN